jgi:hypothetical protein
MASGESKVVGLKWSNPSGVMATVADARNWLVILKTFLQKAWIDWQTHGH